MPAMFDLMNGGIGVMPDPADNGAGHIVPNHESGTQISFEVINVGDEPGIAEISVELDDQFAGSWQSSLLEPGFQEPGMLSLGRMSEGQHTVLVFVNPGSGQSDHQSNIFNVG
jgi:hypothetical protein